MVTAAEFVKVFAPMAKQGKSALEIGRALNFEGDDEKVAQSVSVKASQLRKKLKDLALREAKAKKLDEKATEALIHEMTTKLPRIKSRGRTGEASEWISALDEVLAGIAYPPSETEGETAPSTEETPPVEGKPELVAVGGDSETEEHKSRRRR